MTTNEGAGELGGFAVMLRAALGDHLAPDATTFLQMMAEDGVMEFPYTPPGGVRRLEGRKALAAYLAGLGDLIAIDRVTDLVTHRTTDPAVWVLEFGCEGRAVRTGNRYDQRYISVITVRDGHIARYVDYWNPLVVLGALGADHAAVAQ